MALLSLLSLSASLLAGSLEAIKQQYPEEYNDAKASCQSWAEDDGVPAEEITRYVNQCIDEQIGYLAEYDDSADDSESEDGYQE
jgi:hypothetical protein